jgi:phosphonate transport system permease protein
VSPPSSAPVRRPWWLRGPGLALAVVLALAWRSSEGNLGALLTADTLRAFSEFVGGFFPPAHSADFLSGIWRPLLQTVAIATVGMALALLLGVPLSLLAVDPRLRAALGGRPGLLSVLLHRAARLLLAVMRSIPEVLWALLFVRAVGLGPAAGVLALGVAYGGIVGKVFAEILESTPRGPGEALGGAGARPLAALLLGIAPAARATLASYSLYRFDCAIRASAVLGLVGAGGLGQELELSLKMLRYDEAATWVLVLFALVAAVDALSRVARWRLALRPSLFPATPARLARDVGAGLAGVAAVGAAARILDLSPGDLLSARALRSMGDFARSLWPPDLALPFLRELLPAAAETLAVSILGTAMAAALGLLLALLASTAPHGWVEDARIGLPGAASRLAGVVARAVMNLCRTLPELLWALAFVLAVGLGPFAGALAIGIHTSGVLGRLYAEALDEVPAGPAVALRAAGASAASERFLASLPQAFAQLVAYTLYRWEVNIRAAAVLGVVGAGGLGRILYVSLSVFDHGRTLSVLAVVLVLVLAVDAASTWLRGRYLSSPAPFAASSIIL